MPQRRRRPFNTLCLGIIIWMRELRIFHFQAPWLRGFNPLNYWGTGVQSHDHKPKKGAAVWELQKKKKRHWCIVEPVSDLCAGCSNAKLVPCALLRLLNYLSSDVCFGFYEVLILTQVHKDKLEWLKALWRIKEETNHVFGGWDMVDFTCLVISEQLMMRNGIKNPICVIKLSKEVNYCV